MNNLEIEKQYSGKVIAGVDEVGRGALAGPVIAAAVIVDQNNIIPGVKDSKKLSRAQRERIYTQITQSYRWAVGVISPSEIDEINILQATIKACKAAVDSLTVMADIVLVDGNMKFENAKYISIVKGDDKSYSIAAASIVAKVTRDRLMCDLADYFPEYKWEKNVGYGTKEHINAIESRGQSVHHRKSFKIKE